MNSLLQTLYMTPEFRASLYRWKYDKEKMEEEEADSIPLQLQYLFARMQFLKDEYAISTEALTKSFGWEGSEAYSQQDVQELCRVLFDSLEENFVGSSEGTPFSLTCPSNPTHQRVWFNGSIKAI